MYSEELLDGIPEELFDILERPTMYGINPYYVEGILFGLLPLAMSHETGESITTTYRCMQEMIRELTKDVPAYSSDAKYLCEEQVQPDRKASFELLQERGRELCARLLARWDDASDTTDDPAS